MYADRVGSHTTEGVSHLESYVAALSGVYPTIYSGHRLGFVPIDQ